jgi:hypothetical protein
LKPARANSSSRPYLEKPFTKIGLVDWLKVKVMSSNPSTTKKKKKKERNTIVLPNLQESPSFLPISRIAQKKAQGTQECKRGTSKSLAANLKQG